MKILVTGTHFTPAVAVIEKLLKEKNVEIVYAGRSSTREGDSSPSVESTVLPKMRVKFISIISGRFTRSLSIFTIISLLRLPLGFIQAFVLLLREKPDVVVSFGGYIAVPVVITAWLFSIPILIHEQGLKLGLANKMSALFTDKIALSFYDSENSGKKVLVTGNPLREEVMHPVKESNSDISKFIKKAKDNKKDLILVTGGNQGSHIINLTFGEIVNQLPKTMAVIHITGDSKYHDYDILKTKQNENYLVSKWVDKEFGFILDNCELVVTRAGMNTLQEIGYFEKPMIIIPISNKEQTANARYFKKLGIASVINQKELTGELLLEEITEILKNNAKIKYEYNLSKNINEGAASKLALEILLLGHSL